MKKNENLLVTFLNESLADDVDKGILLTSTSIGISLLFLSISFGFVIITKRKIKKENDIYD